MALNIPMPGLAGDALREGINTGSSLYSRIMMPILEREKQAQADKHFQEQLKLSQAAAGRNAQLFPFRLQELKDKHAAAQFELNFMNQLMGDQGKTNKSGINIDLLRSNPALRGYFKHKFGYDPLTPVPQTPQEKIEGDINKAITIDEAKANRKKLSDIESTAQALLPYIGKVNTIEDILNRKPDLVGRTTQLADMLGMTKDEDVGAFLSAAQALQAHLAKEMSTRGGYGVSKLVEQAKPNIGKSNAYNVGVTKELKQGMKESFEQLKSEYERLSNGKKFPYNFEQYFKEATGSHNSNINEKMVPMISPNGKRVMIPSNKVNDALAAGGRYG